MAFGVLKMVLGVGALAGGVMLVASCGDDNAAVPTVKAPPGVKGPTTEEVLEKQKLPGSAVRLEDFEAIPNLGTAVVWKAPDGTMWQRYTAGILMEDLLPGTGPFPKLGQTVAVSYVGTFPATGKEFDKSPKGKPLEFVLGKKAGLEQSVIKGWNLAVATMKVGGRRRVLIPPELAYGSKGSGGIPPNQALIFVMELVSISGDPVELPAPSTEAVAIPALDALRPKGPIGPMPATGPGK